MGLSLTLYQITFIFILLLCFQKWGKKISEFFSKVCAIRFIRYAWIILLVDLTYPVPITISLKLFNNPIRDIITHTNHFKDNRVNQKEQIDFKLENNKNIFIFIETNFLTAELIHHLTIKDKKLSQDWNIKKQLLLPKEIINKSSFFLPIKNNINFTIGKIQLKEGSTKIPSTTITPKQNLNLDLKNKINLIYSSLKSEQKKIKRLYVNLKSDQAEIINDMPINIKTEYEVQLIENLIKKIDQEFSNSKFYFFILGNKLHKNNLQYHKGFKELQAFFMITNNNNADWQKYFPNQLIRPMQQRLWSEDILFERQHDQFVMKNFVGLFNKSTFKIPFE
jgi:hypothetical protein